MTDWITDRRPTEDDEGTYGYLWVTSENGVALLQSRAHAGDQPWMPITPPEPYVKPKRYSVDALRETPTGITRYEVWDEMEETSVAVQIPTREAAERIAAIYEEVLP